MWFDYFTNTRLVICKYKEGKITLIKYNVTVQLKQRNQTNYTGNSLAIAFKMFTLF